MSTKQVRGKKNLPCFKKCKLGPPFWQKFMLHLPDKTMTAVEKFVKNVQSDLFQPVFEKYNIVAPEENRKNRLEYVGDVNRMQYILPEGQLSKLIGKRHFKEFQQCVEVAAQNVDDERLCAVHHAVLHSNKGGKAQEAHYDYPTFTQKTAFPKYAAIISVDDTTTLDIQSVDGDIQTVSIGKNEILIFRGDVLHGGSGYKNGNNRRIYLKLIPEGNMLSTGELTNVQHSGFCTMCNKGIDTNLQYHRKTYCRAKWSAEEAQQRLVDNRKRVALIRKRKKQQSDQTGEETGKAKDG